MSSLEALIKQHNRRARTPIVTPICFTFHDDGDGGKGKDSGQSSRDEGDEDLKKPYKETLDRPAKGWFDRMPNGCIDSWEDLRERFTKRFALRRRCNKDPTKVSKIIRKANETLPDFKEHWTKEMGYIQGVLKVMQILAFVTNSKCPKLVRRFADLVPRTVTEMMQSVDDFVKSKEAYKSKEFPKGEQPERGHETSFRGGRPPRLDHGNGHQKIKNYSRRDHYQPLDSLTKLASEILATELSLHLPPCQLTVAPLKKENLDRYCDYHDKKGHYTNDCYQLQRQLEAALESGKLNYVVKDVRHMGNNKGRQQGNKNGRGRVINMVREIGDCQKRKSWRSQPDEWMNMPITFPSIATNDISDDPLIIEAKVEGYWVWRVFVDQGAAVQLRAVSSTIYAMVKFLTPKGIATLIARMALVYKCRWSKKRTVKYDERIEVREPEEVEESGEENVLVNPTFPKQTVTIGT
ncbi:hypothetical protein Tco_0966637 [Tanacetum coccineum]